MPVEVRLDHIPLLICFACCAKGVLLSKTEEGSECGGGNDSPRVVIRIARRHLSIGTWLVWKVAVAVLGYWGPSCREVLRFSRGLDSRRALRQARERSHSKVGSRRCDPQQLM